MFKKIGILLFIFCFIFVQELSYASQISRDDIVVVEDELYADSGVRLVVNMKTALVETSPVAVSVVRVDGRIPFARQISSDLEVSLVRLRPDAGHQMVSPHYRRTYAYQYPSYSKNYQHETEVINEYFRIESDMRLANREINALKNKYDFNEMTDESKLAMTEEQRAAKSQLDALNIQKNKDQVQFDALRNDYMSYFETIVFHDFINHFSYQKDLGKLPTGVYELRFIDENGRGVKVMPFEIKDPETKSAEDKLILDINLKNGLKKESAR